MWIRIVLGWVEEGGGLIDLGPMGGFCYRGPTN